jgi:hypothetical protein
VRFFKRYGDIQVNNTTLSYVSDAYWVAAGVEFSLDMTGPSFVYAVGDLISKAESAFKQTSSYMGNTERAYLASDAFKGQNGAK